MVIPVVFALMLVGWAEQHARTSGGGASAPAVATATATLAAYPLPSQPSGPSAKPTATPTRLAAYPLPGTATPVPTSSKSAGPLTVLTTTLPYSLFLPLIRNDCYFKGTAGVNTTAQPGDLWYTNTLAMGVCAGYEWNHVYTPTYVAYSEPWLVINDVRSRNYSDSLTTYVITWNVSIDGGICPGARGYSLTLGVYDPLPDGQAALGRCITYIAASRPGMYWLIWNEPDDGGQDGLTPALGAQNFLEISNTILTADSSAKLIVGNVGSRYFGLNPPPPYDGYATCHAYCGIEWMSAFVTAFMTLTNGATPYDAISGYGFHAYAHNVAPGDCPGDILISTTVTEQCLIDRWTSIVMTGVNWVQSHDPNATAKEIWLTEINWGWIEPEPAWDVQVARMSDICALLPTLPIRRYGWYVGTSESARTVYSLFAVPFTGALSPGGQNFAGTCR